MNKRQQQGAALILVMVGMVALFAMVGLAIDVGHLGLNKARLQNTVDAAALAGAKVLDQTGSEDLARDAVNSLLGLNAAEHPELASIGGSLKVAIHFSATLNPFNPGTTPAQYVRVRATNFTMWNSFTTLVGITDMQTGAAAVAGPSPTLDDACNVAPMIACADPNQDPAEEGTSNFWGYTINQLRVLKLASGNNPSEIGPGNAYLARIDAPGGNAVRDNMAGSYDACLASEEAVETQTGQLTGPVQGINTRFGEYKGGGLNATDFPPDVVTQSPSPQLQASETGTGVTITYQGQVPTQNPDGSYGFFDHADYVTRLQNPSSWDKPDGVPERRIMVLPIADCSGVNNGNSHLPVKGFGCFFLLQPVANPGGGGGGGNNSYVFGQFIKSCQARGLPGPDPNTGPGPHIIQLYDDAGSADS